MRQLGQVQEKEMTVSDKEKQAAMQPGRTKLKPTFWAAMGSSVLMENGYVTLESYRLNKNKTSDFHTLSPKKLQLLRELYNKQSYKEP